EDALPVRIARSAIAPNVPKRDLFVTSGHGLYIDGALVPAGDLVNGVTIRRDAADDVNELEYFHVKLDSHDLVFAEGLACETLLIESEKAAANVELGGVSVEPVLETACAPLLFYSGRRGRIMSRLRSAISPWFDFRKELDRIRDRLEDRAFELCERA
ncbi:MAG: Hint domain-containing protein, partial [Methylocystis sp.]|nr:Hint domain-containing protein [Methylocystis sp.]